MDTALDLHAADAAAGVDPAALRFRQWQHGRRLLAEIEQIRAAESELAARRFRLVAELARDYPAPIEFARNDIAPALHITDIEAYQLLERAACLTTVLPETLTALGAGRIGEAQATAVADAVADTTPEMAAVVDRFAVAAMDNEPLTDRQVYRRAHRQVLKLDPPAAERHHRQQRQARTLARRLSADGMATLRMYATAQDVAAVWDTCTLLADAAEVPGDERDIGNRRVDALVDLLTGILDTGQLDGCDHASTESAPPTEGDGDPGSADDTDDGHASSASTTGCAGPNSSTTNPRAGTRGQRRGTSGRPCRRRRCGCARPTWPRGSQRRTPGSPGPPRCDRPLPSPTDDPKPAGGSENHSCRRGLGRPADRC